MKRHTQFYKIIVILWLTLSIGSVVIAAISWFQLNSRLNDERQAVAARDEIDQISRSILSAEANVDNYVLSDSKGFLRPFNDAKADVPAHFKQLLLLVRDDSDVLQVVTDWKSTCEMELNFMQDIATARERGLDKATAIVASPDFKNTSAKLDSQIEMVRRMAISRQMVIREEINSHVVRANLTSVIAGVFGIGAGVLAFWLSQVIIKHQRRERELTEAKIQAEHSNQEKTVFLANMSHEIRTPMNAILGFSELLESDLRDPKHKHYLHFIRSSAASLLTLINDILDMSKIETGAMELRPEPTDLREICDFVRTLFAEPAAKKNLRFECLVRDDLPHAILIDRLRLRQILVNLVGNAIKFTEKGSVEVRVSWEKEPTTSRITLIVEVQDTGVGIPRDKLDTIFKPFAQAGVHQEVEKSGAGLGLSIVKRLTEMMGGTVTVASVVSQGSAFHLRFPHIPISARIPASEKMQSADVDFNDLRPATLLIVDDNPMNRELISGMFNSSHHRLVFAPSGEEAVEKAREVRPDIVLLDIRMPGMDGYQALAHIRKIVGMELVPSIAVTASTLLEEENLLKEKFSGYVRKPFSKRQLFEELSEFLPQREKKVETVANNLPAENPTCSKELLTQLRQLIVDPWPRIRDSVAVNESRSFAETLQNLGRKSNCLPLIVYAQKLLRDADGYNVIDLEKHLSEFAVLVEQLGKLNGGGKNS